MSTATATATAATSAATSSAPSEVTKGTAKPRAKSTGKPRAKASKSKEVDPKVICEKFATQVMDRYQLEDTVMAAMSEVVHTVLNGYHIYSEQQSQPTAAAADAADGAAPAKKEAKEPKKPRKTSAYNCYVKKMMQDPSVKSIPQKEKMTKIGELWALLPEDGRAVYTQEAETLNASLGAAADAATASQAQ